MKLLRWAVAGATVYAVYRYSIGRRARGEDVFVSREKEVAKLEAGAEPSAPEAGAGRSRKPKAKAQGQRQAR